VSLHASVCDCRQWHKCLDLANRLWYTVLQSSSSSSSNVPISEHSRLHKLTPLWTILHMHPRCVKTNVVRLKVELYCTEPCLPWSTCPASPIHWRTIDGCSKNVRVVLWWVGSRKMSELVSSRKMSEPTKSSLYDNWNGSLKFQTWKVAEKAFLLENLGQLLDIG